MCDCFHLAFPNWHAASSGTGPGRRLRGPEHGAEDDSVCDEPSQFTEGERPRPQGSSPVEEFPETDKYTDSDKECEAEHDPHRKSGSGKKTKKSGLGSMFEKRSTPKMSKLKEVHSPDHGVIVKTAKDGCAEGLVYGGGGKEGIFIKEVVPESPASKSLKLKEGDQVLSATVYFDNVPYEDAIQILEHAQAYKLKLCLKRKPDISESESAIETDVIPEEEPYAPEMTEHVKTKRRGDARFSWPKFPSFGKGRKSRFTRSHSSSEADEQKKLELSPTTSDTESPIKSQDALKSKKRHKLKLSALKKRGRISSSDDQDMDTSPPGKVLQTHEESDLESPARDAAQVYVTENVKVVGDLRDEKNAQKQHRVDLITVDSTLKTADITAAMADKESPSGVKSPDGKKKKKERSELKLKILGKDKSHKKDAKTKSPKRLQTLGASIDIPDQPDNEKVDAMQSIELQTKLLGDQLAIDANTQIITTGESLRVISKEAADVTDGTFMQKSPEKSDQKTKKDKDTKQKPETKTGTTFKLPKVGLSIMSSDEPAQKTNVNVEERTTKVELLTTDGKKVKDDPYEQLSKSGLSGTQLPKREEIEIPGMEDISKKTSVKGRTAAKAGFKEQCEERQNETVQLSIDVDSVKEAVSKLPGYKLPRVDTSGMPIPEEITVIDANAQRISVKTPTKVVDVKAKQEAHLTKLDITASADTTKTTVKLPKITLPGFTSEEPEKKHKSKDQQIKTEVHKREDIIIPGKESAQDVPIALMQDSEGIKPEGESGAAKSPKKSDKKSKKAKITAGFGISKPNIKIPDVGIDLPRQHVKEVKGEGNLLIPAEKTPGETDIKASVTDGTEHTSAAGFGVQLDITQPNVGLLDIRDGGIDSEKHSMVLDTDKAVIIDGSEMKTLEKEGKASKFKMPNLDISMPKVKGPKIGLSLSKKDADATQPEVQAEVKVPEVPDFGAKFGYADISTGELKMEVEKPEFEVKPLMTEVEIDRQGSKFKIPKVGLSLPKAKGGDIDLHLSKKGVEVTVPEVAAEVKHPDVELTDTDLRAEVKAPEITADQHDAEGSSLKFKMPSFKLPKVGISGPSMSVGVRDTEKDLTSETTDTGFTVPKVKGLHIKSSKTDDDAILPDTKAEVKIPDVELNFGKVDVSLPEEKLEIKKPQLDIKPLKAEAESDGQGSKFKIPKLGVSMPKVKGPEIHFGLSKKDGDAVLPGAEAEVKVPVVELKEPSAEVEIKAPEIKMDTNVSEGSPAKFKMPTFKLPKLAVGTQNVAEKIPGVEKDEADIHIPEEGSVIDIPAPSIDVEGPSVHLRALDTEQDGKGSKFKVPHLGFSMPKVKGPKLDINLSKRDTDITSPEAKVDVKLPDVDFGKVDVSVPEAKIEMPEAKSEVKLPDAPKVEMEIKPKESEAEVDSHGRTFKIPKLGIKMPKVKGPELDLSFPKKDGQVKALETKSDVKLPDVDVVIPEAKIDIKGPEVEMKPLQTAGEVDVQGERFKLPKFGVKMPKVKGPEFDFSLSKKDTDEMTPKAKVEIKPPEVLIQEIKAESEKLELDIKPLETEVGQGQGGKFKMPKFGMSKPKAKGPELHLGLSPKDVDVTLPESKVDINLPDVQLKEYSEKIEVKAPEIQAAAKDTEGLSSKFKMPSLSVSIPTVKAPHLSLSKKDVDTKLPEADAKGKLPETPKIDASFGNAEDLIPEAKVDFKKHEVELKPLQTDVELEDKGGKFKIPKLGITMPKAKGADIDLNLSKKEADVTLPEVKAEVEIPEVPKTDLDLKPPEIKAEIDGKGSKFKMPKFGVSMPKVKGPEIDINLTKKDRDVVEAKAEVDLPHVQLKEGSAKMEIKAPETETPSLSIKESPSKFKMPTLKFPKFGVATQNVDIEVPDLDKEIKAGEMGMELSVPRTDVDIPEVTAELHVPEVEVKEPSGGVVIDEQQSTEAEAKVKKPRFSLPRFSFSKPNLKAPEVDVSLPDMDVAIPEGKVTAEIGEIEVKATEFEAEVDGQGSKFKMPKLGISMPKVTAPEIDLNMSKKDVDATLPEATADVTLPDVEVKAEMEFKDQDIKVLTKTTEESQSKFKMPSFKLPKFGVELPSLEISDKEKEAKIGGADFKTPAVDVAAPSMDIEAPSITIKATETEHEGKGSKVKMPKFGITMPKITGPEIDLSLSKKGVDVTLPEAKAEVNLPDAEVKEPSTEVEIKASEIKVETKKTESSPSKFKMPSFKLPKFGISPPNVTAEVPDMDSSVKLDGADIKTPEKVLTVDIAAPSIETEAEGKGSKVKMPKFGITMPKVAGPEIEAKLPDVEVKEPSTGVEIKAPEIKVSAKKAESSPSKFKMPSFKLPKFGVGTSQSVTAEVPDVDSNLKVDGSEITVPEEVLRVDIAAPGIDTEGPSIHVKATEPEHEGKGSKFKMPKFGISMPKVAGPDIDLSLSKKGADVTLPEPKAEIKLPHVEVKEPSTGVEIKAPEVKVSAKKTEVSPSKFKMPSFKLPKFGVGTPNVTADVPDLDNDGADITIPEEVLTVQIAAPSIGSEEPSIQIKTTGAEDDIKGSKFKIPSLGFSVPQVQKDASATLPEVNTEVKLPTVPKVDVSLGKADVSLQEGKLEVKEPELEIKPLKSEAEPDGQGSKFKMPKLGVSVPKVKGPEIHFGLSKKDGDAALPGAEAEVKVPVVELKEPSAEVEIKAPEIKIDTKVSEGSKFKMPTFKLPKFALGTQNISVKVPDTDTDDKIDESDIQIPEEESVVNIGIEGPSIHLKGTGAEQDGKGGKIKMPHLGFSMPKVKGPKLEAKADVKLPDVDLGKTEMPEAKADVKLADAPKVEVEIKPKESEAELQVQGEKFKMPKFGIKMPKVKAPEVDFSLSKKDSDVTISQANVEVKVQDTPKMDVSLGKVEVLIPEAEVKKPELELKNLQAEGEGQGGKFRIPSLGFSVPQVKLPDSEMSLSKKEADVTGAKAEVEVQLPDVELSKSYAKVEIKPSGMDLPTSNVQGSPSKFKMPTFKLPKFGATAPQASLEESDLDIDIQMEGPELKLSPTEAAVKLPEVEIKESGGSMAASTESDGNLKKTRFSLPKFSFSKQSTKDSKEVDVTIQNVDISCPEVNVELKQPEIKSEIQLPDVKVKEPSAKVEVKAPQIEVQSVNIEASPSKLKLSGFTLPKFGAATPKVSEEVPEIGKDIKIDGAKLEVSKEEAPSIDIEGVSVDVKTKGSDIDGTASKFKLPNFGISLPKVKGPEISLGSSKKDVDITLPEAKAEIQLPDVKKPPGIEAQTGKAEGSPSKLKFSLPKVEAATQRMSLKVSDVDKMNTGASEVKLPEQEATVSEPDVPSAELEAKMKRPSWTFPKFSFSRTSGKVPDVDVKLETSEVDVTSPDAKVDLSLPDVEIKGPSVVIPVEEPQPAELDVKKTKFSLPRFSLSKSSVKEPEGSAELPQGGNVDVKQPDVELKATEGDVELDGQGSKFKIPKFGISMPKVKGPEIDLSLKKQADVTLPEGKAEVQLPDIKVETKAPEIEAQAGSVKGSPSKMKLPIFTLPKFGASTPKLSEEVPDVGKDNVNIDGAKLEVSKEGLDTRGVSVEVKAKGTDVEGTGSRFKLPNFGISMPKVKGPDVDLSSSKKDVDVTLPEVKTEVQLPDVKVKQSSSKVEVKAPEVEIQVGSVKGSPSKMKLPTFTLPKFGTSTPKLSEEAPDVNKDIKIDGAKLEVSKEGSKVEITAPSIDTKGVSVDVQPKGGNVEGTGSRFKLSNFGISMPKVKGPEVDLSLSKKDVDVTVPVGKVEVQPPDVKVKQSSSKVEVKAPEVEIQVGSVKGSPSKMKLPTFTLPKFGTSTPKLSEEAPDVNKDINIDGAKLDISKVEVPSTDGEGVSVDVKAKGSDTEGTGSRFKLPNFGISMSKTKGPDVTLPEGKVEVQLPGLKMQQPSVKVDNKAPETDDQLSSTEGSPSKLKFTFPKFGAQKTSVNIPEVSTDIDKDIKALEAKAEAKFGKVEVKEQEASISATDAPTAEVEAKLKQPNWTFPKFSFSRTSGKVPDVDVKLETPEVDEVSLPDVGVQGPSAAISVDTEAPAAEPDASVKKTKFSLSRFSFSKSSIKEEASIEPPRVDVSLPEGEVIVKQPEPEIKSPEHEAEQVQGSKFKLPRFGITLPKAKGPEENLNASQKDVDITLPGVKAEIKLPEIEVKSSKIETEAQSKTKDIGGSPSRFKMPTMKMPKFGSASYDVTVESPEAEKAAESDGAKAKADDIKTDVTKAETTDAEMPVTETDSMGSPSKFKLPLFKMPKLSLSKPKPEDELVSPETETKEDQLKVEVELKGGSKSPKMGLTSFGDILKTIDVEFDVPKAEKEEEKLESSKGVQETEEPNGKKENEPVNRQDTTKSPERTGWFRFPKFGLSSPSEPAKSPEKDQHRDEKSPVDETSPTSSVRSSDAFADISSAMTSEHHALSLSSPTKVTVKFTDPTIVSGREEMQSNIITSTTRTELISVEPNLPEKIMLPSSGVSSSSEDTLRLESGKIHVITSNIQATPGAEHAKLLTDVQVQSAGGTSGDSQSRKRNVFERLLFRETTSEISEGKGTVVITKQISSRLDSSEPISGETASSLQRLKDSVHSEKMKFFDGDE